MCGLLLRPFEDPRSNTAGQQQHLRLTHVLMSTLPDHPAVAYVTPVPNGMKTQPLASFSRFADSQLQ